jgi:energy-coupling factor transporter ATP-binding protein EcfA2
VALARALLRGAALLLLDEPYAGLDTGAKRVVDEVVLAARSAGRTVVLATHDVTRAGLATRTVTMQAGRLLADTAAGPSPEVPR